MTKMPIDVKKLLEEIAAVDEARSQSLSVSVYFDETAPGDLQAFVRQAFASASSAARVSLTYLDGRTVVPYAGDDVAIVVAGLSESLGSCAADLRQAGVPTMVVTTLPDTVALIAQASGAPIPAADLLSPEDPPAVSATSVVATGVRSFSGIAANVAEQESALQGAAKIGSRVAATAADYLDALADKPTTDAHEFSLSRKGEKCAQDDAAANNVAANSASPASSASAASNASATDRASDGADTINEPIVLDDRARASLAERMGLWVVETCKEKRLAFALAFPFVRKPLARDAVMATSLQNAGVGVVVFIPGADMPIMTLNQAKMLLQIAAAYGQELGLARLKELACVVGGGFACRSFARQVLAVVPFGGWAVKGAIGYTGTFAMGKAAIEYFEGGGNLSRFTSVAADVRNKVLKVAAGKAATSAKNKGAETLDQVRDKAAQVAGSVARRVVPPKTKAAKD